MVSDTSVLVYTAWRGIFQRDYFFGDLVRFRFAAVVIDPINSFEPEMIISIYRL